MTRKYRVGISSVTLLSRKEKSLGSGFIISRDGYIVTNNHVIHDADQIKVILHDDKEYDADIIGTDPITDLALIKIDAKNLIQKKVVMFVSLVQNHVILFKTTPLFIVRSEKNNIPPALP